MLDDISPSRLPARDWSNIYPDPNMEDASLYAGSAFTISRPSVGAIPATRISENLVWLQASTEPQETFTPVWPVEAGRPYFLSARIGRITGEGPSTTRLVISWYSDFETSALISSERVGDDVSGVAPAAVSATLTAPANAVRARFSVQKDASTGAIRAALFDVIVRRSITADLISPAPYRPPSITAAAAISIQLPLSSMMDPCTVFSKKIDASLRPASLTKILTVMTVLDICAENGLGLDWVLEAQGEDAASGSGNNIGAGDRFTLRDAIANLLLPSSNVTANVVARSAGELLVAAGHGTGAASARFVQRMNAKAATLGMAASTFVNPHGLPAAAQVTTARDMGRMFLEAIKIPAITGIWGQPRYRMRIEGPNARVQAIASRVAMVSDGDVLGGKTGTITPTVYNLGIFSHAPNGNRLVTVVLRSSSNANRYADMRAILDAVKEGFDWPLLVPTPRS